MTITLTGAAGALGRILRPGLLAAGRHLRSVDRIPLAPLFPTERTLAGDLRDPAFVDRALDGQSAVIHFAGTSVERSLPDLVDNNLLALHALYEGARRHGVTRIVFASSNHAFGMHEANAPLTEHVAYRPDSLYGLSKMWGEGMAQLYWNRHAIETVSLRIGSAVERPTELRHLTTWLGHDDLLHLVQRAIEAPNVGCVAVWGISANTRASWTDRAADVIGYRPTQNAEDYVATVENHRAWRFVGGSFAEQGGSAPLIPAGGGP